MLQLGSWMTTCDQDEEDKSLIAKLFSESWQTLHVQVGNRKLIPNNEDTLHVVATYQALGRLQLAHLLTEGLPQHAIEWLNEACLSTKER